MKKVLAITTLVVFGILFAVSQGCSKPAEETKAPAANAAFICASHASIGPSARSASSCCCLKGIPNGNGAMCQWT